MPEKFPVVAPGPSIYEFLRRNLDEVGRLLESGATLPDEPEDTGGIRWSPGALDGVLGHHVGGSEDKQSGRIASAFVKACHRPSPRRLRALYDAVTSDGAVAHLDAMIEKLVEIQPDRQRLHELGRWLATTASDRDAVKVGIAILGVSGLERDVDVVRVLGAHDEFTLYAAIALRNGLEHRDSELWALAAAVDGWGRIQCVERLADTQDPAVKDWILRTGFRNSVMYEYLAYIAATTGGLLPALRESHPDRDLLTAAGEILEALIAGGPAEDLDNYDDGADAVEAFLDHLTTRAETLDDFHAVDAIRGWLAEADGWDERAARGWTATRRTAFEVACESIQADPAWDDRIRAALHSDDPVEFARADQAARSRGIDTFELHFHKVQTEPLGHGWFAAWQQATDVVRADRLVATARELLPLAEIATGPANANGLGAKWRAHSALDWTLQALRHHPGIGADLIEVGLQSPVVRNRNMALNALQEWDAGTWPNHLRERVTALAASDPNEQARTFAGEVCTKQSNP